MKPFVFLVSLLGSNYLLATPIVATQYNYYHIFPKSLGDLKKELNNNSPIKVNNIIYFGQTHWLVKWNFKWRQQSGICTITSVDTTVNAVFTMPAIPREHITGVDVRRAFSNFSEVLMKHENEHFKSGLNAAQEIELRLIENKNFENCKDLEFWANDKAKKIIEKFNKRDLEYDKTTNHGETEGAKIEKFIS